MEPAYPQNVWEVVLKPPWRRRRRVACAPGFGAHPPMDVVVVRPHESVRRLGLNTEGVFARHWSFRGLFAKARHRSRLIVDTSWDAVGRLW